MFGAKYILCFNVNVLIVKMQKYDNFKVENKAWKPGVARPSKSKARWVNTTNKMQVTFFF